MKFERLEMLYEAGDVRRLHTVATCQEHTISRHVYGTMLIAAELCRDLGLAPGMVLLTLLYHDTPEVVTGDIPAPTKRADEQLRSRLDVLETKFYKDHDIKMPQLGPTEWSVVKASDTLDLAFACLRERRMGNRSHKLAEVFGNCMLYLHDQYTLAPVKELASRLSEEWAYVGAM